MCIRDRLTIPAIVRDYTPQQVKEISLIENLQREDLNPIETAVAIKQLMDEYSYTQEQVADRIGKSRPAVANTLRLLSLTKPVMDMVASGKLSPGHARCLVVVLDAADQLKLCLLYTSFPKAPDSRLQLHASCRIRFRYRGNSSRP